jgi:hypothetical protein
MSPGLLPPIDYAAITALAAEALESAGAPVVFTAKGVGRVFNEDTREWEGGVDVTDTGWAVELPDQAERYVELGLTLSNPVTILVSKLTNLTPAVGMEFQWSGRTYVVKPPVDHVAPNGGPVVSTVIGDR